MINFKNKQVKTFLYKFSVITRGFFVLALLAGSSVVFAQQQRPPQSPPSNNAPGFLDTSATPQAKEGSLVVGFASNVLSAPTLNSRTERALEALDVAGGATALQLFGQTHGIIGEKVFIGFGAQLPTLTTAKLTVNGNVRSSALINPTGDASVCANQQGVLELCAVSVTPGAGNTGGGTQVFTHDSWVHTMGSQFSLGYVANKVSTWTVPVGVNQITVEVFGGGAPGGGAPQLDPAQNITPETVTQIVNGGDTGVNVNGTKICASGGRANGNAVTSGSNGFVSYVGQNGQNPAIQNGVQFNGRGGSSGSAQSGYTSSGGLVYRSSSGLVSLLTQPASVGAGGGGYNNTQNAIGGNGGAYGKGTFNVSPGDQIKISVAGRSGGFKTVNFGSGGNNYTCGGSLCGEGGPGQVIISWGSQASPVGGEVSGGTSNVAIGQLCPSGI